MRDQRWIGLLLFAIAVTVGVLAFVAPSPARYGTTFEALGTKVHIMIVGTDQEEAAQMARVAESYIRLVGKLMSTYDPESEVSRLNAAEAGRPVRVSATTLKVIRASLKTSELSHGAFDITYAPLRALWRRASAQGKEPGERAIRETLGQVGYQKLTIKGDTVTFAVDGMEVDLGGIAKGYAIDAAVEALKGKGARAGLVDIGGDVRLFGAPPDRDEWRVEVHRPPGMEETIVLALPACAVATSGDYERGFQVGDRWYSHIIDPRTGRAADTSPSVTVVAPDAVTADALATALSVLSVEEGIRLAESLPDIECLIMTRVDEGRIEKHMSEGFPALIAEP